MYEAMELVKSSYEVDALIGFIAFWLCLRKIYRGSPGLWHGHEALASWTADLDAGLIASGEQTFVERETPKV